MKVKSPAITKPLTFGLIATGIFLLALWFASTQIASLNVPGLPISVAIIATLVFTVVALTVRTIYYAAESPTGGISDAGTINAGDVRILPCPPGWTHVFELAAPSGKAQFTDGIRTRIGDIMTVRFPNAEIKSIRVTRDGETPSMDLARSGPYSVTVRAIDGNVREIMLLGM